jgi:hypothetical protein
MIKIAGNTFVTSPKIETADYQADNLEKITKFNFYHSVRFALLRYLLRS